MELGTKLKNAREKLNMSQENVADKIGVSRQTLSSWENEKTYPDIISLINLSNLYSVSLDTLLKEQDKQSGYVDYIDKAIGVIKNKQKIYKCLEIGVYLLLIGIFIVLYWTGNENTQNEVYITMHTFLLSSLIVIVSLLIGIDESWGKNRWFLICFFAITYGWSDVFTHLWRVNIEVGDSVCMTIISIFTPSTYASGAFLSFIGLGIGALACKFNGKSTQEK